MFGRKTVLMRRRFFVFGSSMAALAAASSAPALAQCSPDPTVPGGVKLCTGTDSDGLRVTTDDSTVQIAQAARVAGSGGPAITVDIPRPTDAFIQHSATILVGGVVDGGAHSGISVLSGSIPPNSYDYYGNYATVSVAAGATVTGATGINTEPSPGNFYGQALVSISNAGTIKGTGGVALLATDPWRGGFVAIDNAAGGTIGAIVGNIERLNNAGLIDGGASSAIDETIVYNSWPYPAGWTNSGTIRSASDTATIANLYASVNPLTNSGIIANSGTGAAIEGRSNGQRLTATNLAGGTISTAGSSAIVATSINLVNAGTITGDIVTEPAFGTYFFSIIDSTKGVINGNVSLGSGNDLVYGRYDGTQTLVTGITGTLDAGAGTNILVLAAEMDLTVSTAITLPNSFQRLRLAPGEGATMTLAQGFVVPGPIELDGYLNGYGAIINETAIKTAGQAFVGPYNVWGESSLINRGSIDATPTSYYYAVDLGYSAALNNSGTITSSGLGVSSSGDMINSGTILATDTAVSLFNGTFNNSGTIRSTGGIGIDLSGNTDNMSAINSGRIEGASYGAIIGYVLTNSGTISATGAGTAVGLGDYGVLNNLAGGVIEGGSWAVTGHDPYGSTRTYNATVYNAGTINGDVTFVAPDDIYGGNNNNSYVALAGGVLNGNLTLGEGDVLVTDIVNDGEGPFAGINGTVTTTGGLLRYRVSGETSAVVGAVGPFATTGYELQAGAQLTLSAVAPQVQPLVLAGDGMVDVSINISLADQTAMQIVAAALPPDTIQDADQQLHVISRGTLSGTTTDYFNGSFGVVHLRANTVFQNEGTIKASFTDTGMAFNAAVAFDGTLINNGQIELESSYGTYNVETVVNNGTIVQTGSRTSHGITGAATVLNSGTIETAGAAILNSSGVITNSGTIRSTETAAITNVFRLDNLAGGTVTGGNGTAIRIVEAIVNAGTIIGDVDSGYGNNTYYSAGGTLTGNLTFRGGDDLFLQTGDEAGVSGVIDAGAGRDIYGIALTSSGTVAVGPAPGIGFEDAMVAALGANTVATITAVDGAYTNLYAAGDGTVVNTLSVAGQVFMGRSSNPAQASILGATLGTLNNTGTITGGASGAVTQLLNSGIISTAPADGVVAPAAVRVYNSYFQAGIPHSAIFNAETGTISSSGTSAVALQAWGISLALENAGRIEASGAGALAIEATFASTVTVHNSGTILGAVVLSKGNDLVVNSGTMGSIDLGAGDDTLRLVGGSFAGSIAGGEGRDIVEIAGGEARFGAISDVETLRMSAGAASFSDSMSFDEITLTGGWLIGLEGSAITAPTISIARDAIFGSAGTVNGNLMVGGTLSPGASPGTMTVNGNVSLESSSTSIFEITPTVSDKLIVNGNLTISEGATLRVDAIEIVDPGQSRDLIIADSISGRFTNIILSSSLFGVIVQQDDSISLLGQFINDPSFSPQVQRSIAYVNSLLVSGAASDAFLSAAPELDEAAFAQLMPEAYASVGQIIVEHGLDLADVGRSAAFATERDSPGAFTFAAMLGNTRTLNSSAQGTARTRMEGYGLLAGIGWGSGDWSIGGFVGYANSRQTLSSLGSRSEVDSILAGVHGRWTNGPLSVKATVAYDGGNADTRRDLPAGAARADFGLSGWTGDLSLDYAMPVGSGWTARPGLGITIIDMSRDFVSETGGSVYALEVARERDHAIFVDGALAFRGGMQEGSIIRPHVSVGVRYQVDGRNPFATAAMDGGGFGMVAAGARRPPLLGTATAGADIALNSNLMMFAAANAEVGNADRRLGMLAGLRLAF
ncbi:MAG: hypothetical protein DI568_14665 [Sphingomonas sp.]|nr:MAG: hypothetical protein DI568_14665 [Sphingomonas sp.]